MPDLYIPPTVAAEKRREFAQEIDRRCDLADPVAKDWTRKLQQIDTRLMMVRAHQLISAGTPLIPGYYHILRVNDDAPMSVFAIHENGAFCEPDSRIYHMLSAGDLHDPRTLRRWAEEQRQEHQANERDQARADEERRDHLRELVNAATRAQVTTSRDTPWTQNSAGKRGRREPD